MYHERCYPVFISERFSEWETNSYVMMKIGAQHNALNRAIHTNIHKSFIDSDVSSQLKTFSDLQ